MFDKTLKLTVTPLACARGLNVSKRQRKPNFIALGLVLGAGIGVAEHDSVGD